MKLLLPSFIFALTSGCASFMVQNPTLQDLEGSWESTGPVSYFQLSVDKKGTGLLAIVFDEKTLKLYKLEEFKSFEHGFTIKLIDTKGNEKPVSLEGEIVFGRLALKEAPDHDEILWFIKTEDLSKFRNIASDEIKSFQ